MVLLVVAVAAGVLAPAAQAEHSTAATGEIPATGSHGKLKVVIRTPEGVAANIRILGRRSAVADKEDAGKRETVVLRLRVGTYRLVADDVISGGIPFHGTVSAPEATVHAGATTRVRVRMSETVVDAGISVVDTSPDSVSLAWKSPGESAVRVVRLSGNTAPARVSDGTVVARSGSEVTDATTAASSSYSYGLFTRSEVSRGPWSRASYLTVGTPDAEETTAAVVDLR